MSGLMRRDVIKSLGGGAVLATLLGGGSSGAAQSPGVTGGALVQGRLAPDGSGGRKLSGFLETGVANGVAVCSLVRQDPRNPEVLSVFATPGRREGRDGVKVTVSCFTPPVGEITVSVLPLPVGEDRREIV